MSVDSFDQDVPIYLQHSTNELREMEAPDELPLASCRLLVCHTAAGITLSPQTWIATKPCLRRDGSGIVRWPSPEDWMFRE